MVRSLTVMVWSDYLPKESLVVGGWVGEWQTKFNVSPGSGLWSLVLGPSGPDIGPGLDLTWDLDLDLSLTKEELVEYIRFVAGRNTAREDRLSLPRVLGSCSDYLHFVFTDPGPRAGKWVKLVQSFNKRLGTG